MPKKSLPLTDEEEQEQEETINEPAPPATKPKRVMSEERLASLAIARQKALEVKKRMNKDGNDAKIKHLEGKLSKLKGSLPNAIPEEGEPAPTNNIKKELKEKPKQKIVEQKDLGDDSSSDDEPPVQVIKKKPKKKSRKPVVIMEQSSSSDSDDNSNVVYIKKRSSKKKQVEQAPPPEQPQPQVEVRHNPNPFHAYNYQRMFLNY